MRLTVKAVGEHTAAIARLRRGTRVAIEGPYGAFTAHARQREKVALIAGGIGVTSIRSLLEDLPRRSHPVVVLRAANAEELVLAEEVSEIVQQMHGRVHELVGARTEVPAERLLALVPDLGERDVYVSGSEGFVNWVVAFLARVGIAKDAIHYEIYAV
jgi:ferredoxin-NADP reductase